MCGIAGYNCSPKFAEKYLDNNKQEKLLVEAWLHNQHRGWEAAGYMGFVEDAFKSWKRKGAAADLLLDNSKRNRVPNLEVMRVFGAHTRQHTVGDPKVNSNNHPVNVGKVWVTHNGNITNDVAIRNTLANSRIPDVDSAVIAAVLDERVENPRNITEIAEALAPLSGNIAFHAVWQDQPGLSLIGKGTGSPLILAYHPFGIILYGSTTEGLYGMIDAMGLKVDGSGWEYRNLDPNKVFLVENGDPIGYAALPYRHVVDTNSTWARAPFAIKRMAPNNVEVYETDILADWPVKFGAMGRDIKCFPATQDIEEKYDNVNGFANKDGKFGFTNMYAPFGEADRVVYNKKTYAYHVFYGDVEVIVGSDRKIYDVYNHALLNMEERWIVEDKDPEVRKPSVPPVMLEPWPQWYIAKTTEVKNMPDSKPEYEYILLADAAAKRKVEAEKAKNQAPFMLPSKRGNPRGHAYSETLMDVTENDFETDGYLHPEIIVTWDSFPGLTWNAEGAQGVAFVNDAKCALHDVTLGKHEKIDGCRFAQFAALYALSCAEDTEIARCMMGVLGCELTVGKNQICDPNEHKWYPNSQRIVKLNRTHFDLITGEDCWDCGSVRRLTNFPDWALTLMGAERSISNVNT